ncbi:MAG: NUDIX hydrolase [Deltaproteobacteria bacterium]|nr:NUDIX hydrolase [Deltaproteobacteria bacterium]
MAEGTERREYPGSPRVAVGAVVIHDGKILMVCRGMPPAKGLWSIPGGMVELGETLQQAAEREILEETGLLVRAGEPIYSFEIIDRDQQEKVRFHYVIIDLVADLVGGELQKQGGDDAKEARWFSFDELKNLPMSDMTRKLLEDRNQVLAVLEK